MILCNKVISFTAYIVCVYMHEAIMLLLLSHSVIVQWYVHGHAWSVQ